MVREHLRTVTSFIIRRTCRMAFLPMAVLLLQKVIGVLKRKSLVWTHVRVEHWVEHTRQIVPWVHEIVMLATHCFPRFSPASLVLMTKVMIQCWPKSARITQGQLNWVRGTGSQQMNLCNLDWVAIFWLSSLQPALKISMVMHDFLVEGHILYTCTVVSCKYAPSRG